MALRAAEGNPDAPGDQPTARAHAQCRKLFVGRLPRERRSRSQTRGARSPARHAGSPAGGHGRPGGPRSTSGKSIWNRPFLEKFAASRAHACSVDTSVDAFLGRVFKKVLPECRAMGRQPQLAAEVKQFTPIVVDETTARVADDLAPFQAVELV